MKQKLGTVFFLITVLLVLLPFNIALALIVNSPIAIDGSENHREKIVPFSVLTVEIPGHEGNLYSRLNASVNNPPMIESQSSLGIQGFIPPWTFHNFRGVIDGFSPSPIPTSILLIGTSLIGLIGIARRSFFTR